MLIQKKKSETITHLFKISNITALTNLQQTVENKVKKVYTIRIIAK